MNMPNKSYLKGKRFEYRVRNFFKKQGYLVVGQPKSAFPDILVLRENDRPILCECKCNKYLSKDEKQKALKLLKFGLFVVASPENKKLLFRNIDGEEVLL